MAQKEKYRPRIELLALDFLGAALMALGLLEWFSGSGLVPEGFRFEKYELALVAVGVFLMLPQLFHLLAHIGSDAHRSSR